MSDPYTPGPYPWKVNRDLVRMIDCLRKRKAYKYKYRSVTGKDCEGRAVLLWESERPAVLEFLEELARRQGACPLDIGSGGGFATPG